MKRSTGLIITVILIAVILFFTVCTRIDRSGNGQPPTPIATQVVAQ